jgi:hypothetical protein
MLWKYQDKEFSQKDKFLLSCKDESYLYVNDLNKQIFAKLRRLNRWGLITLQEDDETREQQAGRIIARFFKRFYLQKRKRKLKMLGRQTGIVNFLKDPGEDEQEAASRSHEKYADLDIDPEVISGVISIQSCYRAKAVRARVRKFQEENEQEFARRLSETHSTEYLKDGFKTMYELQKRVGLVGRTSRI